MKILRSTLIALLVLIIAITWIANDRINRVSEPYVFNDVNKIPHNKVGLLLGTSKYISSGDSNQYFYNRIKATVALFKAGKIDFIVISGDNSQKYYNEPNDMKKALLKLGIPESKIYLDFAGLRTYDSVIRVHEIFGQDSFTVISQEFHNKRAIFIARKLKLKAIGFNAKDVNLYNGFRTNFREKLARVKVFLDLLFSTEPKHLGEKIEVK
jgi:SanA protein